MLTLVDDTVLVRDDRPAYRPYRATVRRIEELSPAFRRVTFTGDDLEGFGTDALDQRVKIIFPLPGVGLSEVGADDEQLRLQGSWYELWRALPEEARNPFRTYTVRRVDPAAREVDVDFYVHTGASGRPEGPASEWLWAASAGDEVILVGPDARSIHSHVGIDWRPGDATRVLLAGDETAAPAICAILESLPAHVTAHAFIEVPSARDAQPLVSAADTRVSWLARDAGGPDLESTVREWTREHPEYFAAALTSKPQLIAEIDVDTETLWDSPEDSPGEFYAWLAGESAVIKTLRRHLVTETGIDRGRVAFMGYWRLGKSEAFE
ncbi:siderophore-interacting protein [Glaciihabitans arcticus]|uniref:Siderophore-interacting protein n=1 Tax=Glaciihabitans arcticus TaxID=2668039 RepID=A0A4Q9GVY6_9MICO|nr:siderophore-interacting protein [Glaciihabitans arcticus]TBN56833.1 siderophore-interacting protein [Glaciihabitans arcticus]